MHFYIQFWGLGKWRCHIFCVFLFLFSFCASASASESVCHDDEIWREMIERERKREILWFGLQLNLQRRSIHSCHCHLPFAMWSEDMLMLLKLTHQKVVWQRHCRILVAAEAQSVSLPVYAFQTTQPHSSDKQTTPLHYPFSTLLHLYISFFFFFK